MRTTFSGVRKIDVQIVVTNRLKVDSESLNMRNVVQNLISNCRNRSLKHIQFDRLTKQKIAQGRQ